ncbi:HIT family protein [Chitinilyticum piscinae]|uniref:HIT family protein n=1 Tax=Chitinilyticum piscinae TaxID=2866724 RepID=A0A8J7FM73_9NEIS|nr:HIT family protein [Chitinilyticum piscinae]MBE9608971.1 HIT family protein [Chitinilyticum piscinae]
MTSHCPLCADAGGDLLWQDEFCRVILPNEPDYPGFCRVVLNAHLAEMTDLTLSDRERLMRVVYAVESAVRDTLQPDKINLAALGNVVPHLHWHIIARWRDDRHFPAPVWASPVRTAVHHPGEVALAALRQRLAELQP